MLLQPTPMLNPRTRVGRYETLREVDTRGLVVESDSSPGRSPSASGVAHRNSISIDRDSLDGDTPD